MEGEQMDVLTQEQVKALTLSLIRARALRDQGATAEEISQVVNWAADVVTDHACLSLVLKGKAFIDWKDGEVAFVPAG